jgi:hypothetical protein
MKQNTGRYARMLRSQCASMSGAVLGFAVLLATVGCSQHNAVVRGQNPAEFQNTGSLSWEQGGGMMAGPIYTEGPAHGNSDCQFCPPQNQFDVWRPTHHHTWEYNAPQNLTYPQPNQQPAVVQYPYYTVRGPTDFFYK